jgi:segregation and condensation protein A
MNATTATASTHVRVDDEWFNELPDDLYIPPEAFAILLERFEGPLDFLLYLVKKNGLDLRSVDIAPIASQYLSYIALMQTLDVELAADYLVMAALLADLKSRLLLPKPSRGAVIDDDPRRDLLARLEAYAGIKAGAQQLGKQPVLERDVYRAQAQTVMLNNALNSPCFEADLLAHTMRALLGRPQPVIHAVTHEAVQLAERLVAVQHAVQHGQPVRFDQLLRPSQGRVGIVVTLMAVLELLRQSKIRLLGDGINAPLCIEDARHAA